MRCFRETEPGRCADFKPSLVESPDDSFALLDIGTHQCRRTQGNTPSRRPVIARYRSRALRMSIATSYRVCSVQSFTVSQFTPRAVRALTA